MIWTFSFWMAISSFIFVMTMWMLLRHNRRHAFRLESAPKPLGTPLVSFLVPARNEEASLPTTLESWLQSDYPNLEVIVLDDHSTDKTPEILASFQKKYPRRLKIIHGKPLPAGWNGKNWACEQLGAVATGDILLFCDADVTIGSRAVSQTVSTLQHTGSGLVTAIPHQRMRSWGEKAVVPFVMYLPTLGFVSLRFAFRSLSTLFTVANGQWMTFSREAYQRVGGHASVKDAIVEDMAIARLVKEAGLRVCPVLAFEQISVRMYDSFSAVISGFRKNLFALLGFKFRNLFIVSIFFVFAGVLPWLMPLLLGGIWWLPFVAFVLARVESTWITGQHPGEIVFHPIGAFCMLGIAVGAIRDTFTNQLTWKDRVLVRPSSGEEHEIAQTRTLEETFGQKAS